MSILTTVVGSYPIPDWLRGDSSRTTLRDAILVVLKTQELAGLDVIADGELNRFDPSHPIWQVAGIHGIPRVREWDAVTSAEAPELPGDETDFVALNEDFRALAQKLADAFAANDPGSDPINATVDGATR